MTTKTAPKPTELAAAKLRWRCELSRIPFETTAQAELREGFIGQERALRALKMGAELFAPAYNVFVGGLGATEALKPGAESSAPIFSARNARSCPMKPSRSSACAVVSKGIRESSHLHLSFAAGSSVGFGAGLVVMKYLRAR